MIDALEGWKIPETEQVENKCRTSSDNGQGYRERIAYSEVENGLKWNEVSSIFYQ